jgi:hypothetical protein
MYLKSLLEVYGTQGNSMEPLGTQWKALELNGRNR